LVASHDAVIEDIELYNGMFVKTVGSAVVKGDILVSGTVVKKKTTYDENGQPVTQTKEKYVRSLGKVYGTYTDVATFFQPYRDVKLTVSDKVKRQNFLCVFSAQIPLSFRAAKGFYTESEEYSPLTVLGDELPVGIKSVELSKYSFTSILYSREQALAAAQEKSRLYEQNFLSDCTVKSVQESAEYSDEGVTLTVSREVYGVISEESEFFIKK
jgi:similar to stage IV sporulation protein